jgi:hypothetical protein
MSETFFAVCFGPASPDAGVELLRQLFLQWSQRTTKDVSRTYGVSIFIDYCPAAAIQRKVEEKERDTGLINRTRLTAVQPGATWSLMACARRGALIRAPPPPHTHSPRRIMNRSWQPRPKSRTGVCKYGSWIWTATVSMYEFSVQW